MSSEAGVEQVTFSGTQPVSGTVTLGAGSAAVGTVTLGAGSAAVGQITQFRDSVVTAQISSSVTTPAAGATIATVTPGTAGLWEVTVIATILGTTVAATDSNNMELFQTATPRLNPMAITVPGTTGVTFPSTYPGIIMNLSAADTVNVKAIVLATTGAVYAATIVCRRVG